MRWATASRRMPGHPRVGGENSVFDFGFSFGVGPSPRGRGKRDAAPFRNRLLRAIPAWAGKTAAPPMLSMVPAGHPRVGGENVPLMNPTIDSSGPSPRGRGKLPSYETEPTADRAIPAWAGKTAFASSLARCLAGHPRVGGENMRLSDWPAPEVGPSPRGRGKLCRVHPGADPERAIPAWAGKTLAGGSRWRRRTGHPRVGGENFSFLRRETQRTGPSPRGRGKRDLRVVAPHDVRAIPAWAGKTFGRWAQKGVISGHPRVGGENACAASSLSPDSGPSPRGRGKQRHRTAAPQSRRAIPAWAGKTRALRSQSAQPTGHPRVGGENASPMASIAASSGPSPRGRGKQADFIPRRVEPRAIPAWAGKTGRWARRSAASAGHPRVGGENRRAAPLRCLNEGPSPRGRGKHWSHSIPAALRRAIPAWAGKTGAGRGSGGRCPGHPRVGGENGFDAGLLAPCDGPSPRGRGKRVVLITQTRCCRAIPAWAGKTIRRMESRWRLTGHPRVGGENIVKTVMRYWVSGPSPRGRGKRHVRHHLGGDHRAIPAWAGKTTTPPP